MGKLITVISIAVITVGVNGYLYLNVGNKSDISALSNELNIVETQARNQSQAGLVNENTDYNETTEQPDKLVEIVISPEDVRSADTTNTIGINSPYNTGYINKKDVLESIKRILSDNRDVDSIEEKYKEYIISLRHVEMTQAITERKSKIAEVVEEYYKTIGEEVVKEEDIPLTDENGELVESDNPYGFGGDLFNEEVVQPGGPT